MLSKEELQQKLQNGLSVKLIAFECGVSRQSVHAWMRAYGIERNFYVDFTCDHCKGPGRVREKVYNHSEKHFCCDTCYRDWMRGDEYKQWRTGQRIARKVWEEKTKCSVKPS